MIAYKRIAKNTLSLYLRQLISIFVSLYTTRLVLKILGVSDFGLYNVIGGIVPLFTFFASAMTSATQRYISVDLGRGDVGQLKLTFSTIVYIYRVLSLIILIAAETIGLWYLNNKMVIPDGRLCVANVVYQLSVFSCIVSVVSTPYSSAIVAHERLDVYAYVGILETMLRFALALFLYFVPVVDSLLAYAIGLCCVSLVSRIIYQLFCRKHFVECMLTHKFDRQLYRGILSYTSYNMIGSFAIVGKNQGVNLLMNLFFGAVVNAAQGIAMQVINAINSFISNFYMSTRPQIIKLYSAGIWEEAWRLLCISTKYSFYLLLFILMPVLLLIDDVLLLWLGEYPDFTAIFIKLIMLDVLVQSLTSQLIVLLQAENRIKSYQLSSSLIVLLVLPISYLFYKAGFPPYCVYLVSIFLSIVSSIVIVCMTRREISRFSSVLYLKEVLLPILGTSVLSALLTFLIAGQIENVLIKCLLGCLFVCLSVCFVGMSKLEKKRIISVIKSKH